MVATKRTCFVLMAVALVVLATEVRADASNEALVDEVETRHTELIQLLDAGNYDEAMKYYTEDTLYMMNMVADIKGRDALETFLKKIAPNGTHLTTQGIVDTEIYGENTAEIYHHMASIGKDGKPWALYREFAIWKKIGGEWFVDSMIINHRPLSDE